MHYLFLEINFLLTRAFPQTSHPDEISFSHTRLIFQISFHPLHSRLIPFTFHSDSAGSGFTCSISLFHDNPECISGILRYVMNAKSANPWAQLKAAREI